MIHTITQSIAKILLGVQDKLIINYHLDTPAGLAYAAEKITVRELVRLAFLETGVEVEFSGKGVYEKGVIIDLDADRMESLGLNPDKLRFGQTVVKVDAQQATSIETLTGICTEQEVNQNQSIEQLIAETIRKAIAAVNKLV